jgi:NMD protein affecting ribosome stability and mRNA decay
MQYTKSPKYFEGVLQLRDPSEEVLDFVHNSIQNRPDVWIAKTKKYKNGIDLYLSSNKFLAEIAKKLKDSFSGDLIRSNTLFSENRQTSKQLFRGCFLFRYHNVIKGQILTLRGKQIQIIAIGREILGKDMETNRKVHIKFSQLKN